ncbi:MAG: LytR/AlgR family response regulator transcription factor [Croceivirga sp.]
MKKISCLVADDEPIARQILENYISEIPYLTLKGSCINAFEVIAFFQNDWVDVLFLDINMPKLSGLSLLKTLRRKPHVVLTTAYPEYAVQGFELSVTDYLLKPFSLERFLQAISKVQSLVETSKTPVLDKSVPKQEHGESIFVKSDKKLVKVKLDAVSHIEAYGNYIKLFSNEMILTPMTLTELMGKLSENFIRIHKSYVINFNFLKMIDGNQVILENNVRLPIGKSFRNDLLERITKEN